MKLTSLAVLTFFITFAQAPPAKDRAGCQDSKVLSRMPDCRIHFCQNMEYNAFEFPVGKANQKKTVEGEYELLKFSCPATISGLQIHRNAENALKSAGYNIVYTYVYGTTRYYLTAQKGPQWAHVYATKGAYDLTTVKAKEMVQAMEANADSWIQQIQLNGRVSVYGINFDTGKATIKPDSEKVLTEVASLLQKQPDWYMMIAGHTDNVGTDAVNTPLSLQRASSVIAWLAAKGIDKSRLMPAGFGSRKPVVDNNTEEGRAQNRRVDLIKLY